MFFKVIVIHKKPPDKNEDQCITNHFQIPCCGGKCKVNVKQKKVITRLICLYLGHQRKEESIMNMIETENLTKAYGDFTAVSN